MCMNWCCKLSQQAHREEEEIELAMNEKNQIKNKVSRINKG